MSSQVGNLRTRSRKDVSPNGARFGQQLGKILEGATAVFCNKGYEGASMRDIARETGMSLAGMYHYFGNKERLLYLIQKDSFSAILKGLRERLSGITDPEQSIRVVIVNHLQYFIERQQAMKVLSHEDEVLTGEYGQEIARLKREYYHICRELLDRYKKEKGLEFESRTAVLALFGMVNWIYTWYNPRLDGSAERLATDMANIFLSGISRNEKRVSMHSRRRERKPDVSRRLGASRKRILSFV